MTANNKFKFVFQIIAPREDHYYYFCIIISSESSERNVKR